MLLRVPPNSVDSDLRDLKGGSTTTCATEGVMRNPGNHILMYTVCVQLNEYQRLCLRAGSSQQRLSVLPLLSQFLRRPDLPASLAPPHLLGPCDEKWYWLCLVPHCTYSSQSFQRWLENRIFAPLWMCSFRHFAVRLVHAYPALSFVAL